MTIMNVTVSEKHDLLFAAIVKFQKDLKPVVKNGINRAFNKDGKASTYATIDDILESLREPLAKHGLFIVQPTCVEDGHNMLLTYLGHESGQCMISKIKLEPIDPKPQTMVALMTYLKKACAMSITGQSGADEDDDGNFASHASTVIPVENKKPTVNTVVKPTATVNKAPLDLKNPGKYVPTFGKYLGKPLERIPFKELEGYIDYLYRTAEEKKEPLDGAAAELAKMAELFIEHQMNDFNQEDIPL